MPKFKIRTYSSFEIQEDGTIVRIPVTKIVSEDAVVADTSKEVSAFEKYSSKKSIASKCKTSNEVELAR